MGILEGAAGLGLFIGPVAGSAIYVISGDYCIPFFLFAGLLLLITPLILLNLDSSLDSNRYDLMETSEQETLENVGTFQVLSYKRVLFAMIC